jgi:hypothetical protein
MENALAQSFTLGFTITAATHGNLASMVTPVSHWTQSILLLNGEPGVGGDWQVKMNDTVGETSVTVDGETLENSRRATMAEAFYAEINSSTYDGYSATWNTAFHSQGFTVMSDTTGEVFTVALLRNGTMVYNQTHTGSTGGLSINFRDYTADEGDVFTFRLNQYHYAAQSSDTDLTDIAAGLAQTGGLGQIPSWYSPTASGSQVILTNPDGSVLDIPGISRTVTYTAITSIEADTRTHYFTNGAYSVSIRIVSNETDSLGNIPGNETWALALDDNTKVNGDEYTYISQGKKIIEVADGFKNLFGAGSGYTVNSSSLSGNAYFTITSSPKQTVTAEVLQGDGSVHGTFDIDHGDYKTGYLPVLVFSGFPFTIVNVPYTMYPYLQLMDNAGNVLKGKARSEERRVGKECRRLCRSRWSPYH